ncbi:MAG: hypothetical protein QNJ72_28435 [Pleurocapsa sp. MO_226.B13]|nr:hypothetical protein [Pleurocapsa sp. MO_226.B13]
MNLWLLVFLEVVVLPTLRANSLIGGHESLVIGLSQSCSLAHLTMLL